MINRTAPINAGDEARDAAVEYAARTLLSRYGVVFWRLLTQEPGWLPPWRDLLRVYRRLEARGEIRGGRFVAGFSGEQFALPDAVGSLREVRRRPASGQWVLLSSRSAQSDRHLDARTEAFGTHCQPGGLPGRSAGRGADGRQGAVLTELEAAEQWEAEKRLVRSSARGMLADLV
jgi:ATP-dependent Lhr-like helicase